VFSIKTATNHPLTKKRVIRGNQDGTGGNRVLCLRIQTEYQLISDRGNKNFLFLETVMTMLSSRQQQKRIPAILRESLTMLVMVLAMAAPAGAASPTSSMLHNSDNLGTSKGVWGVAGGRYGQFTCTTCHSRSTPNIKRVKSTITAPLGAWSSSKTASVPVTFWNMTGFGEISAHDTSTHICEVCHSKTAVHRYNQPETPHNGSGSCTSCHQHYNGFKKPDCVSCHTSPPANGSHGGHFAAGSASYGQTAIHSTQSAYGFGCGTCHNGTHQNDQASPATAEVVFAGMATQAPRSGSAPAAYTPGTITVDNPGFGYSFNTSNGTCSNSYCHGNYPGSGKNAAPVWGNAASGACGSCHDAGNNPVPTSGSHSRHAFTGQHAYAFNCSLCHSGTVSGSAVSGYAIADRSSHVNGNVNWKFDPTDPRTLPASSYSIPSGTVPPSDGTAPRPYGTCSTTYCHSIVQTSSGAPLTGLAGEYKQTPVWGTTWGMDACANCHGGGHGTALASGSHAKHLSYGFALGVNAAANCTICHKWKATAAYGDCQQCHDNYLGTQYHSNGQVDVRFDTYWGNSQSYSGTPTPGDGFGSCANTYCHSNGTGGTKNSGETRPVIANSSPTWGGSAPCGSCHGWPPAYTSGSPKGNSHGTHVSIEGMTCKHCHATTAATATPDPTSHVNGVYDVVPDSASGVSFTYHYAPDGGTCDNVTCHGSGRKWGAYGDAVYLYFRSPADQNNTMEPMPNAYLTSGTYYGNQGYTTNSGSPGRRVMVPIAGTTEETMVQNLAASTTGNYRLAQFVSPRIAQGVTVDSGSTFSISIRNKKSSILNTVKLRYALYQWSASDSQGTSLRPIAQDSVNISTTATNRTITFTSSSAATFAPGDRIVCELEFNSVTGSGGGTVTNSWGNWNSNNAGLALPVTMRFLTEN
jgi:predicted CxxxxCH...CXXCH cytochrome family protein